MDALVFTVAVILPIILVAPVVTWILCERQYQPRKSAFCVKYQPHRRVFEVIDAFTGEVEFENSSVFQCQEWIDWTEHSRS